MKNIIYICVIVPALFLGLFSYTQSLAAFINCSEESVYADADMVLARRYDYTTHDPVSFSPNQVSYSPLSVKDPSYTIPWGTSRFRCYFKDNEAALKFEVRKAWITYRFVNGVEGRRAQVNAQKRSVVFSEVFPGVDVKYTVESDHVLEEVVLYEPQEIADLVQEVAFEGVIPIEKDGGIYFWNGEKFLFGIPPPVMYEVGNKEMKCSGLHYELESLENSYYLRKVIDEEGLRWLMAPERVYPVVIDATTQSFEDPWESSGLTPFGQYFETLSEYVSPTSGSLTVTHTDFCLPGRGLDIVITRVYTTPAIFAEGCRCICTEEENITLPYYEDGPYGPEFECPPVDVGNGWQLDFPWIGDEYIHYLDGTMYKKNSVNHEGHHFTFVDNVLTAASGVQYDFSGGALSTITDPYGNVITFGYSDGHLTTITDTLGRVINLSYNDKGQLIQISYGSYTVTYSYSLEALASVTDPLGRVTTYQYDQTNNWLLTKIAYPAGGYSDYTYSYFSQEVEPPDPLNCSELRKYHVTDQALYSPELVRRTVYAYQGDFDGITSATSSVKNEQNITKLIHEFSVDTNGLISEHVTKDGGNDQLRKVVYTYSTRKEVIQEDIYMGTTFAYTLKHVFDSWGNKIYDENGEGQKVYSSFANTDSQNMFRDYGNVLESSNQFFDNSISSSIHTALVGSVRIQDERVIESYCRYDSSGHLVETRQVFQLLADYSSFSGIFDENGQMSFSIDLTGIPLDGDAVLKVTGLPSPNGVTKTETHSKFMYCTWLNAGYWDGNKFYAEYVSLGSPPEQGYEPVGPFLHYPGTAGYQGYTKWVSQYTQYVETTYVEAEDKYPEQVEYNLNGDPWSIITTNLDEGTVFCSIPVEELIAGMNVLNFQELSTWMTKFEWSLYVPHTVTPIEEASTELSYDTYGNLSSITDALGNITSFGYDTQYHAYLTSITNAVDNTMTAGYDFTRGFLTSVVDAKGFSTSFEYDILGRITTKINPDLTEKEAVYDDENNTVTIYDELDHKTVKYFDGIGRLTKVEWYLSPTTKLTGTYTYNYLNKTKTATDSGGHVYSYEYDPLGRLVKQFSPDSTFRQIQYNDTTNTVTVLDGNQHKKEYHYDWADQLVWVREYTDSATYYLTQYTYDSLGHMATLTDAKGNTTLHTCDSMFGVTQVTYPDLTTESFSYDSLGNVVQKTDVNGTTTFTYDATCQVASILYPDQSSVTYGYDANGNRTSMIDSEGTTLYTYDNRNRLLSETRTTGGQSYTVSYGYNAVSKITSITYPDLTVISREHDPLSRLINIPGYAEFAYNTDSLLSTVTYANGVVTNYQYDINERPISIHAAKDGTNLLLMNYQFDPVGNITQLEYDRLKDELWEESLETFQYDWLDRLTSVQGDYGSLLYSYDPVGNRISQNNIDYTYNNMNELLSMDSGSGSQEFWWDSSYSSRKEITFGTDHDAIPEGYTCTFSMDTTVAALQSGDDIRIVYQTDTQAVELDRIGDVWNTTNTKITFKIQSEIPENAERGTGKYFVYYGNAQAGPPPVDPLQIYLFCDNFNRVDSQVVGNSWIEDEQNSNAAILRISSGQLRVEEHRNEYAHVEQVISGENVEVSCRIKPVANGGYGWAQCLDLFWNDDNNGNHIQLLTCENGKLGCKFVADGVVDSTFLDGIVVINAYNWVRIRLTSDTIYYDYGGTGTTPVWVNKLTKSRPSQLSGSFSKIILGKGVEQVSYTNSDLDNNYATPGDLGVQYIDDIIAQKYIENPPEISLGTTETPGGEEVYYTFTYDDMGNMVTKSDGIDTWVYTYDVRNQLIQVENQGITSQYSYDGSGRRIQKTEWIESLQEYQTIVYVYSGPDVIYEKNTTTGQEAIYIYGPQGKIAKNVGTSTDYYHSDHLGSMRLRTDESGNVISEVQYKAFGESDPEEESYLYTGKEKDSTGLYYYGARYYDCEIGRFISRDPQYGLLENPQTFNRYTYCLNNPLRYIDPDGRDPIFYGDEDKEEQKVWIWSQNVNLIEYTTVDYGDYTLWMYYCMVAGAILGIIGIAAVLPLLAPYISSLAVALKAAGPKVATAVLGALNSAKAVLAGLPWKTIGLMIYKVARAILFLIGIFELCTDYELDIDFFTWGFILTITFEDRTQVGWVTILGEEDYQWKSTFDNSGNMVYFVKINGEWVQMPDWWKPGDPIPPENVQ